MLHRGTSQELSTNLANESLVILVAINHHHHSQSLLISIMVALIRSLRVAARPVLAARVAAPARAFSVSAIRREEPAVPLLL